MEENTTRRGDVEAFKDFRIEERERDHLLELLDVRAEASDGFERDGRIDAKRIGIGERWEHGVKSGTQDTRGKGEARGTCTADFAKVVGRAGEIHGRAACEHSSSASESGGGSSGVGREESRLPRRRKVGPVVVRVLCLRRRTGQLLALPNRTGEKRRTESCP